MRRIAAAVVVVAVASLTWAEPPPPTSQPSAYPALQKRLGQLSEENAALQKQISGVKDENQKLRARIAELSSLIEPAKPDHELRPVDQNELADAFAKASPATAGQLKVDGEKMDFSFVKVENCKILSISEGEPYDASLNGIAMQDPKVTRWVGESPRGRYIGLSLLDKNKGILFNVYADRKDLGSVILAAKDKNYVTCTGLVVPTKTASVFGLLILKIDSGNPISK